LTNTPHPVPHPLQQHVAALNEQLSSANSALDAAGSDLIALQRASSDATLRLQREMAALTVELEDARAAEEAARRRAATAEERLRASQARQAEVEAGAAEQERSLNDQLRGALAQAQRYQELANNEQQKREEVGRGCVLRCCVGERGWLR
jgi:hypothetical protein